MLLKWLCSLRTKVSTRAKVVGGTVALVVFGASPGVALAEGAEAVVVTEAMLQPVTDAVTQNLGVLLPVGLTILAIMLGIALIPRILWRFF